MKKTKYKEAGNGNFIRFSLDENGKELCDTKTAPFGPNNKAGMGYSFYCEMLEWLKTEGNKVEPKFTVEERALKDQEEVDRAWEATKSTCIRYLDESEKHVSNHPPYPNDSHTWEDSREQWWVILRSGTVQKVPPKPFGE